MGGRPDLQEEIQDAEKPEAGRYDCWEHQEAHLGVLPTEDGSLPYRAVPPKDEEPAHRPVLVVPVSGADPGSPLQGVS